MKLLHSICQQIWKTKQWPQDRKRSVFILIPKKGNAKECSNYQIIGWVVWWHHRLDGHVFKQTPEASEERGSLECCSSCGRKLLDMTDWQQQIPERLVGCWFINKKEFIESWTSFTSLRMTTCSKKSKDFPMLNSGVHSHKEDISTLGKTVEKT